MRYGNSPRQVAIETRRILGLPHSAIYMDLLEAANCQYGDRPAFFDPKWTDKQKTAFAKELKQGD